MIDWRQEPDITPRGYSLRTNVSIQNQCSPFYTTENAIRATRNSGGIHIFKVAVPTAHSPVGCSVTATHSINASVGN